MRSVSNKTNLDNHTGNIQSVPRRITRCRDWSGQLCYIVHSKRENQILRCATPKLVPAWTVSVVNGYISEICPNFFQSRRAKQKNQQSKYEKEQKYEATILCCILFSGDVRLCSVPPCHHHNNCSATLPWSEAYRPIRNVRKWLHINLQISLFLGEGPPDPAFATPPPIFLQKRLHIKKPLLI